jgi:hypothetical protein
MSKETGQYPIFIDTQLVIPYTRKKEKLFHFQNDEFCRL